MAVIKLSECKITVVCIYRASDGNFREFLSKLELVIQKLSMKGRQLILCGDWNLNFLQENVKLNELKSSTGIQFSIYSRPPDENYKEY
jgi:exonuclease III